MKTGLSGDSSALAYTGSGVIKLNNGFPSKCCQDFAHRPKQNAILNVLTLQRACFL